MQEGVAENNYLLLVVVVKNLLLLLVAEVLIGQAGFLYCVIPINGIIYRLLFYRIALCRLNV